MIEPERREVDHDEFAVEYESASGETLIVECADEAEAVVTAAALDGTALVRHVFVGSWASEIRRTAERERCPLN